MGYFTSKSPIYLALPLMTQLIFLPLVIKAWIICSKLQVLKY